MILNMCVKLVMLRITQRAEGLLWLISGCFMIILYKLIKDNGILHAT